MIPSLPTYTVCFTGAPLFFPCPFLTSNFHIMIIHRHRHLFLISRPLFLFYYLYAWKSASTGNSLTSRVRSMRLQWEFYFPMSIGVLLPSRHHQSAKWGVQLRVSRMKKPYLISALTAALIFHSSNSTCPHQPLLLSLLLLLLLLLFLLFCAIWSISLILGSVKSATNSKSFCAYCRILSCVYSCR